jgi:hypothetical protein
MKLSKYISIAAISVVLAGCSKYLENEPQGGVSEDKFFTNINELSAGVTSVYSTWQTQEYEVTMAVLGDLPSDDFVWKDETDVNAMQIETFSVTPDNSYIKSWYKLNYQGIFKANQVIKSAPRVKLVTQSLYARDYLRDYRHVYGQALFFRALFYFKLVQAFGGVPIQPETYRIGDQTPPRASREDVFNYIEKDLREAIFALKGVQAGEDFSTSSVYGQINKFAAAGLLEKVLIYRSQPGIPSQNWSRAKVLGDFLVKNADLSFTTLFPDGVDTSFYTRMKLDASYKALFSDGTYVLQNLNAIDGNQFVINNLKLLNPKFITCFMDIDKQNTFSNQEQIIYIMHKERRAGDNLPYETGSILPALYGGFNSYDGNCKLVPTQSLAAAMNGDPRNVYGCLSHNAPLPADYAPDVNVGGQNGSPTFLVFVKFWAITTNRPASGSAYLGRNTNILRYADVLLLYAEALNENGDKAGAVNYLNMVRQRVKLANRSIGPYEKIRQ